MSKQWALWALPGIFFPSIAVLGVHAYLGSFNRFIADDYCSAYYAEKLGMLRSVWFWYLTWFGGYAASMTDSILPLIGSRGMVFTVFAMLVIWLVVVIFAIFSLWPKQNHRKDGLLAAVSLAAATVYVTLLLTPNITQSLYWWGGMRGYIPPLLFATSYVVLFQQFMAKNRSCKGFPLWLGLSFLIPFIAGGFSETFTPVQVVFFVFIIGFGLITRKFNLRSPILIFLVIGLIGSITALFVMVLAPGNAIRQAFFPKPPDLFTILRISATGYLVFLQDIFSTLDKIAGLAGITAAAIWLGILTQPEHAPKNWVAPAILFAGFVFSFGCFPSAAYGLSDVPPTRTLIIPVYFLIIGFLIAGFTLGQWLTLWGRDEFIVNPGFCIVVSALMLFSAWTSGQALYSSRQYYIDYAQKWDQMEVQIIHAKIAGDEIVVIPIMTNWAGLDNPNDNPKFWLNYCYSKYYGINVVTPSANQ